MNFGISLFRNFEPI